jgi:hypothetical protein
MGRNDGTVVMEGVRIVFRNFTGKEGMYNAEGDRNFGVLLDDKVAAKLLDDGWPVKVLKAREEGDEPQPYLQVSVKYRGRGGVTLRPPRIVLITTRGHTNLGEDEIELLDSAEIINVDLIVRPFEWEVNGKTGIKAYLQSMYVTIEEDPLARKYGEMEDARRRAALGED